MSYFLCPHACVCVPQWVLSVNSSCRLTHSACQSDTNTSLASLLKTRNTEVTDNNEGASAAMSTSLVRSQRSKVINVPTSLLLPWRSGGLQQEISHLLLSPHTFPC
ncbi:hypothetical protein LDENG_00117260 [Lucifuga dentata]|nr:hypothetical protein LDENG_00117260 [Lucifuga dentata]